MCISLCSPCPTIIPAIAAHTSQLPSYWRVHSLSFPLDSEACGLLLSWFSGLRMQGLTLFITFVPPIQCWHLLPSVESCCTPIPCHCLSIHYLQIISFNPHNMPVKWTLLLYPVRQDVGKKKPRESKWQNQDQNSDSPKPEPVCLATRKSERLGNLSTTHQECGSWM